jgi:hypothetical protein
MFRRHGTVLGLFLALFCALSATAELQKFGVEFEYGAIDRFEDGNKGVSPERYVQLLEEVKNGIGSKGTIQLVPWEKYPDKKLKKAVFTDEQGRVWQVVPEYINNNGIDGYEFVTPPLETEADLQQLRQAISNIENTKSFGRGNMSSSHVTFDVSRYIKPNGDASDLVDLILYVESHWPEIYAGVNPKRYGRTMNSFAVPLAANQRDLLKEISDLPRERRTLGELEKIFRKFDDDEFDLVSHWKDAFKYRAANYRKLFGFSGEKKLPVIEFRIPDLQSAESLEKTVKFLSSVVEKGPALQQGKEFLNPFSSLARHPKYNAISDVITGSPQSRYASFLNAHGLSPSTYSWEEFQETVGPKPGHSMRELPLRSLENEMNEFSLQYRKRPLSSREKRRLASFGQGMGPLPLLDWQNAEFLNGLQRRYIADLEYTWKFSLLDDLEMPDSWDLSAYVIRGEIRKRKWGEDKYLQEALKGKNPCPSSRDVMTALLSAGFVSAP